jgi:hypothetical protein
MTEKPETCTGCGRYTERGRQQLAIQFRAKPLSGIDLTRPLSKLVEDIRSDLATARSKLNDIGMGFTGWRDRLESVEGLLTCGLVALHHTMEEMREHERRFPKRVRYNGTDPTLRDKDAAVIRRDDTDTLVYLKFDDPALPQEYETSTALVTGIHG